MAMTQKLPIAVSMIARNEAHNLPRSLSSVAEWVQEIVLVVNDCADGTEEIARGFGATVIPHPWEGYRDQKRFALTQVTAPWVLALDADEEVSEALKADIHAFFQGDHEWFQGAMFPRKVWFLGRWIRHGDWYPDAKLRLLRREKARSGGSPEHDKFELTGDGPTLRLAGDLLHYSFRDVSHYLSKHVQFSDDFLVRERAGGKRFSLFKVIARPCWRFFRAYVLRLGFLDGFPGLWIAGATAFFNFVRYSRTFEDKIRKV